MPPISSSPIPNHQRPATAALPAEVPQTCLRRPDRHAPGAHPPPTADRSPHKPAVNTLKPWLMLVALLAIDTPSAFGRAGYGVNVGSWVFSPYVEINAAYDSNVYKERPNETEDFFIEPELGLRFSSSRETNRVSVIGNIFLARREFFTEEGMNFYSFGDAISVKYGGSDTWRFEFAHAFRRLRDIDRHASDIEDSDLSASMLQDVHTLAADRDIHQAGLAVARRVTRKIALRGSYRFMGTFYTKETHYLDLEGHVLRGQATLRLTDKSSAIGSLSYGTQTQEGTAGEAITLQGRLGLAKRGTDKLQYRAAAGLQLYERPKGAGGGTMEDFNLEAGVDWYLTEKTTFRGGAVNGTQLSSFYQGNGMEYISGWAGIGYRMTPRMIFSTRAIFRRDDYIDRVAYFDRTINRVDERFEGHLRFDYFAPTEFLKLFIEGMAAYVESNFTPVEYDLIRITIGAALRY